jgi:hypothetical protein
MVPSIAPFIPFVGLHVTSGEGERNRPRTARNAVAKRSIMNLQHLLFSVSLLTMVSVSQAQTYTIAYEWLNIPCATNLNCNEGCSACALPENSSPAFFGTNMGWVGVQVCPMPVTTGNNALYSNAWPPFPDPGHFGMVSALATVPMQIDSIIIRHRREVAGPQRMKILYTGNVNEPTVEIADVDVDTEFVNTTLTDLGCLEFPQNMVYGTMQLRVQPYMGNGGNWHLDAIRIVGTPCSAITTGIGQPGAPQPQREGTSFYVDVLGRSVKGQPDPGVYIGNKRVVQIF